MMISVVIITKNISPVRVSTKGVVSPCWYTRSSAKDQSRPWEAQHLQESPRRSGCTGWIISIIYMPCLDRRSLGYTSLPTGGPGHDTGQRLSLVRGGGHPVPHEEAPPAQEGVSPGQRLGSPVHDPRMPRFCMDYLPTSLSFLSILEAAAMAALVTSRVVTSASASSAPPRR